MKRNLYLRVHSPELTARLRGWITEYAAAFTVWQKYATEVGATNFLQFAGWETPTLFSFMDQHPPENWTKPTGRHRASNPKRTNKAALAEIAALPKVRNPQEILTEYKLPTSYKAGGSYGTVGSFFEPWRLSWTEDEIVVVGFSLEAIKTQHLGKQLVFNVGDGTIPAEYFEIISEARSDLIFAEARVRREEAKGVTAG